MLHLKAYQDDRKIQEIRLGESAVEIGRSPSCQVVLPDLSVSRKHARIEPHGNYYIIRDNQSTNGTIVNDRAIQAEVLHAGDAIRVGKFVLIIEAETQRRGDTSKIRIQSLPPEILAKGDTAHDAVLQRVGAPLRPSEAATAASASERLGRLHEIQQEIGYLDSMPALLDRSLKAILDELEAERGCILLGDFQSLADVAGPQDLVPSAIATRAPSTDGAEEEILVPEELIRFLIDRKASTRLKGIADGASAEGEADLRPEAMGAPFLAKDRFLGMVYVERRDATRPFTAEELQILTLISSLVAVNLTNTLLFDEIFAEKEKLQAVITGLAEGVLITDTQMRVIEASARAATLLEEEENLIGKTFLDLTHEFKHSIPYRVLESEVERGGCLLQLDSPSGERSLKARIMPFVGNVSGFRGRLVFLSDATESRRIEEKKIEFIRNVAHKLRTPLTLIEGNLPLLHGEMAGNASESEILRDVEKGSRALCELVDEFVTFMEMEIHEVRTTSATQEVNLSELSWAAINAVLQKASEKHVMVNNKLPGSLPMAMVQPERFRKALVHILENAVKFSPDGGIVSIEGETDGDVIKLHVIDGGPGIPASQQEAIFRVFHQVDEQGTGEVPGLGLGLAIARQIVQENSGDIQVTSPFRRPGGGCCITVLLVASNSPESRSPELRSISGKRLG